MSSLTVLRDGFFRRLWAFSLVQTIGVQGQVVAASWLMTVTAGSADLVALVQTAYNLPVILLSLLAGTIADNYGRRQAMMAAQWVLIFGSAALALAAWLGFTAPWLILTLAAVIGCGFALNTPAWQSMTGDLVPREHIADAVAINSVGFNFGRAAGPAAGGALVAVAGPAAASAVIATTFLPLLALLARSPKQVNQQTVPGEALWPAVLSGLRYTALSPRLLAIVFRVAILTFGASVILALLPIVTRDVLQGGSATYGALVGIFGAGSIFGAFASKPLRGVMSSEWIARGSFLVFAGCSATLAAGAPPLVLAVALLLAGAAWVITISLFNATVQLITPRWVAGRCLSIFQSALAIGIGAGSWTWGVVASVHGLDTAFLLAAAVLLAGALLGLVMPVPGRHPSNLDLVDRWREPSVAVPVSRDGDRCRIAIAFRIREGDQPAFRRLMAARRRIRLRDGARRWELSQDLSDPELWTETYETRNWADYVRHVRRMTVEDDEVNQQLLALHRGGEAPAVTRSVRRSVGEG